jgi:uncharacterized protein YegL
MPIMMDDKTETFSIPGVNNFTFTGAKPVDLNGSTKYSLSTIIMDCSGSVAGFKDELLQMLKECVKAAKKSPTSDLMLMRVVTFNNDINEVHGFLPVKDIDIDNYKPLKTGGMTTLYDACVSSVGATNTYAKSLYDMDYILNGIVFIVTDGEDNVSKYKVDDVKKQINNAISSEQLESIVTILIGVGNDINLSTYLQSFVNDAKIDNYITIGDANANSLAKLARFISQSVSSQSQSVGTGGPSTSINKPISGNVVF